MSDLVHTYYGARQTCLEMMKDRGYDFKIPAITEEEFKLLFEKQNMDLTQIKDASGRPVLVKFLHPNIVPLREDSYKNDVIAPIAKYFGIDTDAVKSEVEKGTYRVIVFYNPPASSTSPTKFEERHSNDKYFEVFSVRLMCANPIRHRYQPKFTLMTDTKEITDKYDAKSIMLGAMCIDDPVNRYYGGQIGQVYEIVRNGTSIYYRRVVGKRMNLE